VTTGTANARTFSHRQVPRVPTSLHSTRIIQRSRESGRIRFRFSKPNQTLTTLPPLRTRRSCPRSSHSTFGPVQELVLSPFTRRSWPLPAAAGGPWRRLVALGAFFNAVAEAAALMRNGGGDVVDNGGASLPT